MAEMLELVDVDVFRVYQIWAQKLDKDIEDLTWEEKQSALWFALFKDAYKVSCLGEGEEAKRMAEIKVNGERIRELREDRGWSQFQLSRKTGWSRSAIASWERGVNKPRDFQAVLDLANVFKVHPQVLMRE